MLYFRLEETGRFRLNPKKEPNKALIIPSKS